MKRITISTEFIKLDQFLKFAGAADTGGECKMMVQEGYVLVNGEQELRRGRKLYPGDTVSVRYEDGTEEFSVIR